MRSSQKCGARERLDKRPFVIAVLAIVVPALSATPCDLRGGPDRSDTTSCAVPLPPLVRYVDFTLETSAVEIDTSAPATTWYEVECPCLGEILVTRDYAGAAVTAAWTPGVTPPNTAFQLMYDLDIGARAASNINWVSPPFLYRPNGILGAQAQNSKDFCFTMSGGWPLSNVLSIALFDPRTDNPRTQFCESPIKVFDLTPGEGYMILPNGGGKTVTLLGSHDNDYAPNKGGASTYPLFFGAGTTNNNLVSLPYHAVATNATELCTELNSGIPQNAERVISVTRYETRADHPQIKFCANRLPGFDLTPGEAYMLVPAGPGIEVAFDVY